MEATTTTTTPDTRSPDWVDKTKDTLDTVRTQAQSWDEQLRAFATEKPLAAVLCAVAGGYVLARISTWR